MDALRGMWPKLLRDWLQMGWAKEKNEIKKIKIKKIDHSRIMKEKKIIN